MDKVSWWKKTNDNIEIFHISNAPKTTIELALFRSNSVRWQFSYVKKCWKQLLLSKEKVPPFQVQIKEENWMENTDIELLNLKHFKTKAKFSNESHTTFIYISSSF